MSVQVLAGDPHDQRLLEHVHPTGWTNPTPTGCYNLVVIGAGTAGLVAAAGAAGLGAKVALVERELMGGDCLNVGCVPSKAIISAARVAAAVRDSAKFGVTLAGDVRVDFPAVMDRLRRLRADIAPNDSAERFRDLGVDVFLGQGRFTGPDTIDVGGQTLCFRRAVIATGARAHRPDVPGLVDVGFLTNESVFTLTALPARLAVLGGGPIGCELAQAFARFGSQVTVLERSAQLLGKEDRDAATCIEAALERDGVTILRETTLDRVERSSSGKRLHVTQTGQAHTVDVDEILVGTGRVPNVDGLDLEAANVAYDVRKGVTVDDRLRTTNPRVYAAGDVCSPYKFTHAADFMARIVIQNALFYGRANASELTIPWCTYTSPEVAHVGLTERDAADRGLAIQTFVQPLEHIDRAILEGHTDGFVKVHVRKGTDRIVGATIVAEHAGEMIGELTLAIKSGLGLRVLGSTIHPYPTVAEAIRKVGDQYNRTRLTPLVKALFERWLRWTR
ncbi:MAG: mercuric reductase [Planctomycetaceae bacterium]|nr:mercuric reductase [Planctomycetaceae bacterium]